MSFAGHEWHEAQIARAGESGRGGQMYCDAHRFSAASVAPSFRASPAIKRLKPNDGVPAIATEAANPGLKPRPSLPSRSHLPIPVSSASRALKPNDGVLAKAAEAAMSGVKPIPAVPPRPPLLFIVSPARQIVKPNPGLLAKAAEGGQECVDAHQLAAAFGRTNLSSFAGHGGSEVHPRSVGESDRSGQPEAEAHTSRAASVALPVSSFAGHQEAEAQARVAGEKRPRRPMVV